MFQQIPIKTHQQSLSGIHQSTLDGSVYSRIHPAVRTKFVLQNSPCCLYAAAGRMRTWFCSRYLYIHHTIIHRMDECTQVKTIFHCDFRLILFELSTGRQCDRGRETKTVRNRLSIRERPFSTYLSLPLLLGMQMHLWRADFSPH